MENKVRKRGGIIMKRKLRAAAVIVFAVVLFASMSLSVFADDWYYKTNPYVKFTSPSPSPSLTIYKGYSKSGKTKKIEAKTFRYECKDRYSKNAADPGFPVTDHDIYNQVNVTLNEWNKGTEEEFTAAVPFNKGTFKALVVVGGGNTYISPAGKYKVKLTMFPIAMPADEDEPTPDEPPAGYENLKEEAWMLLYIKALRRPTNVKMRTGKHVVKVTFTKAKGANYCIVYRATKKNGKYKKVGSTNKSYFYDRKAAKGKKYYYKLKSLRRTTYKRIVLDKEVKDTNMIYSKFTSPKRCKKVK